MIIGIPKERRSFEFRVGLTPALMNTLTELGHTCYIEHNAGQGAGFSDQDYEGAGGRIVYSPHEAFGRADLVLKVARPLLEEIEWLQPGAAVAGLLHLPSAREEKIRRLCEKEITTIAYEQIQLPDGRMPVRRPLSQIGGRLAAQIGARLLQNNEGGNGILLGGIASVPPAEVVIVGAGVLGRCAARAFYGMGARITVLDNNLDALQYIYEYFRGVVTMVSNSTNIARACTYADVLVGAVLVAGERAPVIVTREMVRSMKPRSVVIDMSIDDGGCVETSRLMTHENPTFIDENIIHYCVPNVPAVVARTSTFAFLNAATPYILDMVTKGVVKAVADDPALEPGVQIYRGELRHLSMFTTDDKVTA